MNGAASSGHLDVVKFIHQNRNERCIINAMDAAAHKGQLEVVH